MKSSSIAVAAFASIYLLGCSNSSEDDRTTSRSSGDKNLQQQEVGTNLTASQLTAPACPQGYHPVGNVVSKHFDNSVNDIGGWFYSYRLVTSNPSCTYGSTRGGYAGPVAPTLVQRLLIQNEELQKLKTQEGMFANMASVVSQCANPVYTWATREKISLYTAISAVIWRDTWSTCNELQAEQDCVFQICQPDPTPTATPFTMPTRPAVPTNAPIPFRMPSMTPSH